MTRLPLLAWAALGALELAGLLALAGLATAAHAPAPDMQPGLIGFGCEGAAGPLYAIEESDFPICERIEPR